MATSLFFHRDWDHVFKEALLEAKALKGDYLSRVIVITLGSLLNCFFLDIWIVAVFYAGFLLCEMIQKYQFREFEKRQTRRLYWLINLNTLFGGFCFAMPAGLMWFEGEIGAKLIALSTLFGGLVHVAIVRASHLPMGVSTVLPIVLTLLAFPFDPWIRGESLGSIVTSSITISVVLGYFFSAFVSNNKTKRDLVKAIADAQKADAAKSQFLASMSHEIRTPLNGIIGMTQVIQHNPRHEDIPERIRVVAQSARSLLLIVDDLLDLSKIEAGHMEINRTTALLQNELSDVVELYRHPAKEKDLRIHLVEAGPLPTKGDFDTLRVRQCLGNLISNAIKFTEAGSLTIRVESTPLGPRACLIKISVTDTGIGIPADKMNRLFSRFSQLCDKRTAGIKGTGLGLAITKQLSSLMGGTVGVESTEGVGSTFSFSFRMENPVFRDKSVTRAALPPGIRRNTTPGQRILLVVDDNDTNRFVARNMLEPMGYLVDEARSGEEALDLVRAQAYHVILMDIRMPGIDGVETFRRIRGLEVDWAETPVIALTADAMASKKDEFLTLGMSGYVAKPIDQRLLVEEIERTIGASVNV